jgi:hypothetical protein
MLVMLSRPPTGTLRTTRVTNASIALAALTFAASAALAVLLLTLVRSTGPLLLLPVLLLAGLGVGSVCLALYGLRQRR